MTDDEERIMREADLAARQWDEEIARALQEPQPDTGSSTGPYEPGDPPPGCLQTIAMIVVIALIVIGGG